MAPFYRRLSELVSSLGDEYMKMVMITGESPDMNRDYELFRQVPDFEKTLQRNLDALTSLGAGYARDDGKEKQPVYRLVGEYGACAALDAGSPLYRPPVY